MTTETIDRLDEILSLASAPAEVLSADHPHEGAFLARFVHDLTVGGASDKLVTRSLTPGVVGVKGP